MLLKTPEVHFPTTPLPFSPLLIVKQECHSSMLNPMPLPMTQNKYNVKNGFSTPWSQLTQPSDDFTAGRKSDLMEGSTVVPVRSVQPANTGQSGGEGGVPMGFSKAPSLFSRL